MKVTTRNTPILFISFSTKDLKYVRELMSGLKFQNVMIWDFSDDNEAIEAGKKISSALVEHIEQCDFFVPIISKNSVVAKYTIMEVNAAFELNKKMIPILIKGREPEQKFWPAPYSELQEISYLELDINDEKQFIRLLIRICEYVGIEYDPFEDPHPRLPCLHFFRDEVRHLKHRVHEHVLLSEILGIFNKRFREENWHESLFLIEYFLSSCRYLVPDYPIFYPWIIKAVCERELGWLEQAEQSYLEAKKIRPEDENVFGGLAGISCQRGDLQTAKMYAKKALDVCPSDRNIDETFNYVVLLLQTAEKVPRKYVNKILKMDEKRFAGDETKVLNIKGLLFYQQGEYQQAQKIFETMENRNIADTATIGYHLQLLLDIGEVQKANTVLQKALKWSQTNKSIDNNTIRNYLSNLKSSMILAK